MGALSFDREVCLCGAGQPHLQGLAEALEALAKDTGYAPKHLRPPSGAPAAKPKPMARRAINSSDDDVRAALRRRERGEGTSKASQRIG